MKWLYVKLCWHNIMLTAERGRSVMMTWKADNTWQYMWYIDQTLYDKVICLHDMKRWQYMTIHEIHWPDIMTRHDYRTWWHKMLTIHDNPCDTLNRHYDKMICLHDMKRWQYMTLNEIHWQDMITGHDDMTRNWRRKGIAFFLFKKILKRK